MTSQKVLSKQYFISFQLIVMLLVTILLSGCTSIRLIAEYDETIDISVTGFQEKMETFLTYLERHIGKEEATYENNIDFYDEVKVDLSGLRVRAAALPKNDITIQQIDLLVENVKTLEKLHEIGITPEDIYPLRTAFNASCTAILKLELAKKRGEK